MHYRVTEMHGEGSSISTSAAKTGGGGGVVEGRGGGLSEMEKMQIGV